MAEGEVVSLVEAMPESAYDFAPTQGAFKKVRTFGEQVKHVATVMYMAAAAVGKGEAAGRSGHAAKTVRPPSRARRRSSST